MNDKPRMIWFSQICDKIRGFGVEVCIEKLFRLFGQLAVNGYECKIYDTIDFAQYSYKFLGFGLYIPISIFNHSCQPNAAYVNFGNKIQVRAIKTIAANDQIFIDYIPLERSKLERRFTLMKDWYFYCMCNKCESDFDDRVDYKALKCLVQINDETVESDFLSDYQLSILKQVYNGFHPGFSFYLLINLSKRVDNYLNDISNDDNNNFESNLKSKVNIKESILLLFKNLTVTHGKDHEIYKLFKKLIYKFGIHNVK
jgi:hypothetical protein